MEITYRSADLILDEGISSNSNLLSKTQKLNLIFNLFNFIHTLIKAIKLIHVFKIQPN